MADIILVAVIVAFIAVCVVYVQWCDRIIGPDDFGSDQEALDEIASPQGESAAPAKVSS